MMVVTIMANRIYFAQHGLAVSKEEDPDRPLSTAGIQQTTGIAEHLSISNIPIANIYHSGKLRAQQTAEIYAAALNVSSLSTSDHLSPDDDIERLVEKLDINQALYVGHLPHLEKLTSYLVSGQETPSVLTFKNSAVVCLEKNNDLYAIEWYLTPELII